MVKMLRAAVYHAGRRHNAHRPRQGAVVLAHHTTSKSGGCSVVRTVLHIAAFGAGSLVLCAGVGSPCSVGMGTGWDKCISKAGKTTNKLTPSIVVNRHIVFGTTIVCMINCNTVIIFANQYYSMAFCTN